MKSTLPGLVLLALLSAGCGNDAIPPVAQWLSYSDQGMTLKFPSKPSVKPQSADSSIGTLNFDIVSCEMRGGKQMLMAVVTRYPIDPDQYDVEIGLEGAVKGVVSNTKGKLHSMATIDHEGIPGREFSLSTDTAFARCRTFIDGEGPTQYAIQAWGDQDFVNGTTVTDFFESLEIAPEE